MRNAIAIALLALVAALMVPWDSFAQDRQNPPPPRPVAQADPTARDFTDYRTRVGDRVQLVVFQRPEWTQDYIVPANGQVSYLPIGKIGLLDRTVFEIQREVEERLRSEGVVEKPRVGCVVLEHAPRTVYVYGATHGTINLPVHRNVRLLELLAMTGALGIENADFTGIHIRRTNPGGSPYLITINVDDILVRNDERKNIVIFENDFVHIPRLQSASPLAAEFVYVLGKVGQPGRHPIVRGKSGFTLVKLIAIAGDFQEFANRDEVVIIRTTRAGRQRIVVDFDEIIENKRPDLELQGDDIIHVSETFF